MNKWCGKYKIIYADPPWGYNCWKGKETRTADSHYDVMSLDDICALDVSSICDDECALFIWVTCPFLESVFRVIDSWGFEYKTVAFTWVKQNKKSDSLFWGLGHYTRANAEYCLLCKKKGGKMPKVVNRAVHSVIISSIEGHSKKPDEARDRIVQLFGNIPRIELFAREKVKGWHCFGNEVESNIEL